MLVLIVGLITGTEQINAERPKDETNIPSSQGCPLCIMCRVLGVGAPPKKKKKKKTFPPSPTVVFIYVAPIRQMKTHSKEQKHFPADKPVFFPIYISNEIEFLTLFFSGFTSSQPEENLHSRLQWGRTAISTLVCTCESYGRIVTHARTRIRNTTYYV